jgi:hypothetical protein
VYSKWLKYEVININEYPVVNYMHYCDILAYFIQVVNEILWNCKNRSMVVFMMYQDTVDSRTHGSRQ